MWKMTVYAFHRPNYMLFLAHMSRRLIGELIGYSWSGVCPSSSVRRSQCSKIFFSETAGPITAKFYVEPPWVGGTIFCSRHLGHMTKMAATLIYGKNPSKIFFSRTGRPIFTKLGTLVGSEQYIRPDVSICIVRKSLSLVMTLKMVNAFYLSI